MAFVILWTELARNDLRAIVEYIAKDNPAAARKTGYRLIAIVESLAEFPKQTRMVPEYGQPHLREAIAGNYRLVIRIQEKANTLAVVRIWHAARGRPEVPASP